MVNHKSSICIMRSTIHCVLLKTSADASKEKLQQNEFLGLIRWLQRRSAAHAHLDWSDPYFYCCLQLGVIQWGDQGV